MNIKFIFIFLFFFLLVGTVKADSYSLTVNFIVPADDTISFNNCQNFTDYVNTSFSEYQTASATYGVDSYWLNDTTNFDIDATGLITNATVLEDIATYYLIAYANSTNGAETSCDFWIQIKAVNNATGTSSLCRYRYFGYWNDDLPYFRESGCI